MGVGTGGDPTARIRCLGPLEINAKEVLGLLVVANLRLFHSSGNLITTKN